jgi:hypothetical protein
MAIRQRRLLGWAAGHENAQKEGGRPWRGRPKSAIGVISVFLPPPGRINKILLNCHRLGQPTPLYSYWVAPLDLISILRRLGEIERALEHLRLVKRIQRPPNDPLNELERQQVSALVQMVAQLRADIRSMAQGGRMGD